MSDKIYDVSADWAKRAWIDDAKYREMYARSIKDPNGFWSEQAKRVDWIKPFTKVENTSFELGKVSIKWFEDGVLNAAYNCIDRHLEKRGDQTAIIWEGDDPSQSKHISYRELHDEVCKMANILRLRNVKKGDRVTIYLPMIPEAAYAILACARIGAIHSVVFGGFSPDSIAGASPIANLGSSSPPTRACAAARTIADEGQRRCRDREGQRRGRLGHRGQAHRRQGRHEPDARRLVSRGRRRW